MPRLRPVRTKEEAAQVPSDESLDIDLTEPEIEIVPAIAEALGLEPQEPQPPPVVEPESGPDPEARLDDVASLKERLVAAEKAAELQKQQIAAYQQRQHELERERTAALESGNRNLEDAEEARYVAILNGMESAESEIKVATSDLERAKNDGDVKLEVDAQRRLTRADRALAAHEEAKASYEAARKDKREQPQSQQQPSISEYIDRAYAKLPQVARNWLKSHPDYATDQRKVAKVASLHYDIVEEGHQGEINQSYLDSLETKLGLRQAPQAEVLQPQPAEPRRAAVTSAPPTREAPSLTTGKPQSSRITLTPEQREAAKISGVDEITYARGVMRLSNEKKNGRYQERG